MSADRFTLDTNILVYALDGRDPVRHGLARAIVRASASKDCILTNQAVCELYAAATRRLQMPPRRAAQACRSYLRLFPSVGYDRAAVEQALGEAAARRLALWDALLVAAAEAAGCTVLLSEDMADGARFGQLVVRHPFTGGGLSAAARRLTGLKSA